MAVSTHSRLKAAVCWDFPPMTRTDVSTHSRPKAAGYVDFDSRSRCVCFNTQPPEGGWMLGVIRQVQGLKFQHTAARRRLGGSAVGLPFFSAVSTHSRPKAAGARNLEKLQTAQEFQHTAARRRLVLSTNTAAARHGFNTQPPEGGWDRLAHCPARKLVSTHSRPKAAGPFPK